MKNIKFLLIPTLFATLVSCVNGDDYGTPDLSNECVTIDANITVSAITTSATGTATEYPDNAETDDFIEAYVTSSDEGGNFYKSISMVSTDGNIGFSMPVDSYNLYNKFEPGRKVTIKMDGRFYNVQHSSTVIGSSFNGGVGRISGVEYEDVILRSCEKVDEEELVNNFTIAQAKNNANINKLIEFDAVQFTDGSAGGKYFDSNYPNLNFSNPTYPSNIGGATNHQITDADGNKIIVRVSEFASFASSIVPMGRGKIRGVLTKFNNDFQFMIRTLNDVKLDQPRIDANPPIGGTDIQFLGSYTETFESYTSGSVTTGQRDFPKYINDPAEGGNYWYCEAFSGNKYLKMSAFSNNSNFQFPVNRVYFIMPVNFTAANNMSFKSQDRFNVGGVLKVYYSTDYIPLGIVDDATLVNITSNFTIASGTTGSASQPFVNSGVYNFPAGLTGNGFIIFEYTGGYSFNPALTTTMHIDDIVIN